MPLINCLDCGKEISESAEICIHCGRAVGEIRRAQNELAQKNVSTIVGGIVVFILISTIASIILPGNKNETSSSRISTTPIIANAMEELPTPTPFPTLNPEHINIKSIVGKSPQGVSQILGKHSKSEKTKYGQNYYYKEGEVEITFIKNKVDRVTITPHENIPLF